MNPPLCPEVGLVALVPDRWSPRWQPRHFVLSRLARYFPIVWVDYPHQWRDSLRAWRRRPELHPAPPAGLQIYRPEPWLPLLGRPRWMAGITARARLQRARNVLRAQGCSRFAVYIWRPEFADALNQAQWDLSLYHIDDEYSFSPTETEISPREEMLLKSASQVFIHSPALWEKKSSFNPNCEYVPNGVNYHAFATPTPEPSDLRDIPHPRIGYVGNLKQMLNWDLLLELSARQPHRSFVFVGPLSPHAGIAAAVRQMSARKNVYFLGGKAAEELGAYPQHFDVCIMPYKMDDYTKYIYPLKMHEYLASGRPVLSTPIRSVEAFQNVIATAITPEEWSQAIDHALSPGENSHTRREQRQSVAREHDWDTLVLRIARLIARRLHVNFAGSSQGRDSQIFSACAPLT
jgi:glycosyltransferase involved in cell wall biosynthesis